MRIACIHQGYELYGSDRSFAECVSAIRQACPDAFIEVVLPRPGPITTLLDGVASAIVFEPIWVLRRRNLAHLATFGLARLPGAVLRAVQRFRRSDLVYVNTSVIADYAIAARMFPQKALLHIHEIPEGATLKILRAMVAFSGAELIFNSRATSLTYPQPPSRATQVIYNGVCGPAAPEAVSFHGQRPLRVAMLGRVNRIKGQEVLVEAVRLLPPRVQQKIEVRIVGSAFEDAAQEAALAGLVAASGLSGCISLEPFTADAAPIYKWADIVAVPSRRPESLGRVGIEAMSFGRPVIASAIGGLAEVVADKVTGWLVPPGEPEPLARQLAAIAESPGVLLAPSQAARQRYEALFSEATAARAIGAAVLRKLRAGRPAMPAGAIVEDVA